MIAMESPRQLGTYGATVAGSIAAGRISDAISRRAVKGVRSTILNGGVNPHVPRR
jgi:hypothetical protein